MNKTIFFIILICFSNGCNNPDERVKENGIWTIIKDVPTVINVDTTDFNSKETAEIHYEALKYYKEEKFDKANTLFKEALNMDEKNPIIMNAIGNAESKMEKFEAAEKAYKMAIEFRPEFIQTYINYGNCLLEQKKFKRGIEVLKRGEELEEFGNGQRRIDSLHYSSLLYNLGLCYHRINKNELSKNYFKKSREFAIDEFSKKGIDKNLIKLEKNKN